MMLKYFQSKIYVFGELSVYWMSECTVCCFLMVKMFPVYRTQGITLVSTLLSFLMLFVCEGHNRPAKPVAQHGDYEGWNGCYRWSAWGLDHRRQWLGRRYSIPFATTHNVPLPHTHTFTPSGTLESMYLCTCVLDSCGGTFHIMLLLDWLGPSTWYEDILAQCTEHSPSPLERSSTPDSINMFNY